MNIAITKVIHSEPFDNIRILLVFDKKDQLLAKTCSHCKKLFLTIEFYREVYRFDVNGSFGGKLFSLCKFCANQFKVPFNAHSKLCEGSYTWKPKSIFKKLVDNAKICLICHKDLSKHQIDNHEILCSKDCKRSYGVIKYFQNRYKDARYRGPNWWEQKGKCILRDKDTCQLCGLTGYKFGK